MKTVSISGIVSIAVVLSTSAWAACEDLKDEYQQETISGALSSLAQSSALLGTGGSAEQRWAAIQEHQRQSGKSSMNFALRMQEKKNELDNCRRDNEHDLQQDENWQDNMENRNHRR